MMARTLKVLAPVDDDRAWVLGCLGGFFSFVIADFSTTVLYDADPGAEPSVNWHRRLGKRARLSREPITS